MVTESQLNHTRSINRGGALRSLRCPLLEVGSHGDRRERRDSDAGQTHER